MSDRKNTTLNMEARIREILAVDPAVTPTLPTSEIQALLRECQQRHSSSGESTLRALMQYVPEGITIVEGPDMEVRFLSRYGEKLLGPHQGQTIPEVVDKWQVYHDDCRTPMKFEDLPVCRALQHGEVVENVEIVQINSNGHHLHLLCNAGPIRDEAGNITGAVVAWRDVRFRRAELEHVSQMNRELEKRVEQRTAQLRDSERMYRMLTENTRDVVYSMNAEGVIEFIGPQISRYGLDPEALVGTMFLDWIYEEDREGLLADFERTITDKAEFPSRFRIQNPDGETFWLEELGTIQYDTAGRMTGVIGVLRDITERKREEERRQESEERYRRLFETETDAVMVFDTETREFVDVNPAALKMYGYTREEFLKLKHWDIVAEPEKARRIIEKTLANASNPEIVPRALHRRKDGTIFPVEIAPGCFTLNGRSAICGIVRDITERVEADKERLEQQQRLKRLAAQLANAQDEEQQRIAQGLHDDVAQLLTACDLKLALAAKTDDAEKLRRYNRQASELVKEAGRKIRTMSFELGSATLYRLGLQEAVEELSESMEDRYGIHVFLDADGSCRRLQGASAVILYKAIRELLFNVTKHAGVSEAYVSMHEQGNELRVSVEDRGKGAANLAEGKEVEIGRGLGLFGIRERLRDVGGRMSVESKPGKLTRVTLWAPFESS